jgi:hypothetical protein
MWKNSCGNMDSLLHGSSGALSVHVDSVGFYDNRGSVPGTGNTERWKYMDARDGSRWEEILVVVASLNLVRRFGG